MKFNILVLLLLGVAGGMLAGCASMEDEAYDPTVAPETASTHDDAHGWGANIQNTGKH